MNGLVTTDFKYPYNKEAEMSVIGAMILDPSVIPLVKGSLLASHFYFLPHQLIYKTLLGMNDMGSPIDIVTIKDELVKKGLLDKCGGIDEVVKIMETTPTSSNIQYYARIIKEAFIKRQHISMANKLLGATSQNKPLTEIIAITKEMEKLREGIGNPANISILLESAIEDLKRSENGYEITTGIGDIDVYTHGLGKRKTIIMAAETSHGKTAMALNMVLANLKRGIKCYYYTFDMAAEFVVMRLSALAGGISLDKINKPMVYKNEQEELRTKMREIIKKYESTGQLIVRGFCPIEQIEADIAGGETGLVVIDYIQTSIRSETADKKRVSKVEQVDNYIAECKRLASKYGCCFLVLSQFNRTGKEFRKEKRRLSDLRDSGGIEQGGDIVIFLEYPFADTDDQGIKNDYIVRIMKNNMGRRGKMNLHFDPEYQTFREPIFDGEEFLKK